MTIKQPSLRSRASIAMIFAGISLNITACGGGSEEVTATDQMTTQEVVESSPVTPSMRSAIEKIKPNLVIRPNYHMAPYVPPTPDDVQAGQDNSGHVAASSIAVPTADIAGLSTARLTPEALQAHLEKRKALAAQTTSENARPATTSVTKYTYFNPAQIRAAYLLPPLPAAGTPIAAADAPLFGAGQTIYILDAYHLANSLTLLNAFSTKFGLPLCKAVPITTATKLPLAKPAASTTNCEFSVAYVDKNAQITNTVPAVSSSWTGESALDIQWAHAIAPLARIVLIEAPAPDESLIYSVLTANKMGPGTVSMSWATGEDPGLATLDKDLFTGLNMTYFGATGDSGTQNNWPAMSPLVTAVGGTSLGFDGSTRYEEVWSGAGGGVSAFYPVPSFQQGLSLAGQPLTNRADSDVGMNADPSTGQLTAMMLKTGVIDYYTFGGTSLATPMWAAVGAISNAMRQAANKPYLNDIHNILYTNISKVPGKYTSGFADITVGSNGASTCSNCSANIGYDIGTGLGSPNSTALLSLLMDGNAPWLPSNLPDVKVGAAFKVIWPTNDPVDGSKLTYSAVNLPMGVTVSPGGIVLGAINVAGYYNFQVTVKSSNGGSSSGIISIKVGSGINHAPIVQASSAKFLTNSGLQQFQVVATDEDGDTLAYSMSGAPAGLTINPNTGLLSWAAPVRGVYSITVTAKDPGGLKATGVISLTVKAPNVAPKISMAPVSGKVGTPISVLSTFSDANGDPLTFSVIGGPTGMYMGPKGGLNWPSPVAGIYNVTIVATDPEGLTGSANVVVTVIQPNRAPTLKGSAFPQGFTGQTYISQIQATDPDIGDTITYSVAGGPIGLTVAGGVVSWAKPVTGSYSFSITAKDSKGATSTASFTLKIVVPPTPPKISMAPVSGKVGTPISVLSTFSDANGDSLTFSVIGGPTGMYMGPKGGLNWPSPVAGVYNVTIVATDPGGLSGTADVVVTVVQPNRAPKVSAATLTGTAGVAFYGQVVATDDDNHKLTYSMTGAPSGLVINGTTGALTWAKAVKGTFNLIVTAKDTVGATGSATIKLVVS